MRTEDEEQGSSEGGSSSLAKGEADTELGSRRAMKLFVSAVFLFLAVFACLGVTRLLRETPGSKIKIKSQRLQTEELAKECKHIWNSQTHCEKWCQWNSPSVKSKDAEKTSSNITEVEEEEGFKVVKVMEDENPEEETEVPTDSTDDATPTRTFTRLIDAKGDEYVLVHQKDPTMMQDMHLIHDVVIVLVSAAGAALLASVSQLPIIIGYLLAGAAIGPSGFGLIEEFIQVESIAQFGVAFLLFALGVEFSLAKMWQVRHVAVVGALLQTTMAVLLCVGMALLLSLPIKEGVFLGMFISMSSTAVTIRCLEERGEKHALTGQVMLGILVVQDILLGLCLAILPAMAHESGDWRQILLRTLAQLLSLAAIAVTASIYVLPQLLLLLSKQNSREVFLLGVVAICLSIASISDKLGISIEMGSFIAGLMISEGSHAEEVLDIVEPIRDVFGALFFCSIGMLIDAHFLWDHLPLILLLAGLVLSVKLLIIVPSVLLFNIDINTAVSIGIGLSHVGEFAFVLASKAQALGLIDRYLYLLLLGTTALSLLSTPFLFRHLPKKIVCLDGKQHNSPAQSPVLSPLPASVLVQEPVL